MVLAAAIDPGEEFGLGGEADGPVVDDGGGVHEDVATGEQQVDFAAVVQREVVDGSSDLTRQAEELCIPGIRVRRVAGEIPPWDRSCAWWMMVWRRRGTHSHGDRRRIIDLVDVSESVVGVGCLHWTRTGTVAGGGSSGQQESRMCV